MKEQNDEVRIDVSLIPEHVTEELAAATLDFIKEIMKDPEKMKVFEKKKKELGLL